MSPQYLQDGKALVLQSCKNMGARERGVPLQHALPWDLAAGCFPDPRSALGHSCATQSWKELPLSRPLLHSGLEMARLL